MLSHAQLVGTSYFRNLKGAFLEYAGSTGMSQR